MVNSDEKRLLTVNHLYDFYVLHRMSSDGGVAASPFSSSASNLSAAAAHAGGDSNEQARSAAADQERIQLPLDAEEAAVAAYQTWMVMPRIATILKAKALNKSHTPLREHI